MSASITNVYKALSLRELGGRRPGTATNQSRRLYQSICPNAKAQQLDIPEVHICRFSPCGQYLICFAGGFTQLVVYRFTGPRLSWQGDLEEAELTAKLSDFSSFFTLLYRLNVAPAGEVLARDVVQFMAGGSLLLLASHSPYTPPPPAAAAAAAAALDPLAALPIAASIHLHLVRLADGVRVGGSRLEGELVDLSGRPAGLGVCAHEDLICVLAVRSQVVHLLQVLRGGEEVLPVRCLGPHVREDDLLVLRTADEAEERWRRQRAAEREAAAAAAAAGRASMSGGAVTGLDAAVLGCGAVGTGAVGIAAAGTAAAAAAGPAGHAAAAGAAGATGAAAGATAAGHPQQGAGGGHPIMLPVRRSMNGDLVRNDLPLAPGVQPHHSHHQHQYHQHQQQLQLQLLQQQQQQPRPAYAQHYANGAGPGAGSGAAAASGGGLAGPGGRPPRATPAVYATVPAAGNLAAGAAGVAATAATGGGGLSARGGGLRGGYLTRGGRGGLRGAGPLPSAPGLQAAGAAVAAVAPVAAGAATPPVAGVLYPPRASQVTANGVTGAAVAGAAGGGGAQGPGMAVAVTAADREALAAQQAAVRQAARHHQLEQLAAQAGPGAPPPPALRRSVPGTAGATAFGGGGGLQPGPAPAGPGATAGGLAAAAARAHRAPAHGAAVAAAGQLQLQPGGGAGAVYAGGVAVVGQNQLHPANIAAGGAGGGTVGGGGAAAAGDDGGEGACITGIKQRLLAHLYTNCLTVSNNNPRRLQREAMSLFRQFDTYRSLIMRKVYLLDRRHLLIDWRTPAAADLGGPPAAAGAGAGATGGPGAPPGQFLLLFDLQSTRVLTFKPSTQADRVVESYLRTTTAALPGPWAEALAPWDRYNYDAAVSAARAKMAPPARSAAGATAAAAAAAAAAPAADGVVDRAAAARKLLQLLPPATAVSDLSPSPYLDPRSYNYDDRAISLNIRTRPSLEQPVSFRPRKRPDRAGFRLEPGPYEAMVVRDRRLARSVSYLVHPDAPFVMSVFSVFQQTSFNINFRV
ncbi:hypothetical protein HYH02_011530 [Chlamydomonas schloesseri]|uniref:Uncharacterized protein n=1 Tax=Chlamydomonas schloesseri TaxID=2026947 RepID=A0A835T5Q0_9CHLO|nr:hypothetical protein HYH02_011530 [Chlamydomonas schloesseri]|eukprot:KAG2436593.1 hypothetical protein HYH02_011530 [Chlamydomonas schloesseri]